MQSIIKADDLRTTLGERSIAAVLAAICALIWSGLVVMSVTNVRKTRAELAA